MPSRKLHFVLYSILLSVSVSMAGESPESSDTEFRKEVERLMRIMEEKESRMGNDPCPLTMVRVHQNPDDQALVSGISGWVMIRFTITKTGEVTDPIVIAADPPGIFETIALELVTLNKYKPMVLNGEPVEYSGWAERVDFLRWGQQPGSNWPMPKEYQEGPCEWNE